VVFLPHRFGEGGRFGFKGPSDRPALRISIAVFSAEAG
jgi:hypothetical protein